MKRMFVIAVLLLSAVYAFGQDKEQVVSFLYENDDQRTKFNEEIIFIEEFNFGIPGGKNWLVGWEDQRRYVDHQYKTVLVFVYVVDIEGGEIKFRKFVEIEEVEEDGIESVWPADGKEIRSTKEWEKEQEEQETGYYGTEYNETGYGSPYLKRRVLIGIVIVAAIVGVVMVRKKIKQKGRKKTQRA